MDVSLISSNAIESLAVQLDKSSRSKGSDPTCWCGSVTQNLIRRTDGWGNCGCSATGRIRRGSDVLGEVTRNRRNLLRVYGSAERTRTIKVGDAVSIVRT
jgi:hypothetical protein